MIRLALLACFISSAIGAEVCCYDTNEVPPEIGCYSNNFPFNSMPLPDCMDKIQVSMRVYTRLNPDNGAVITRTTVPSTWQQGKQTHFVVHGWLGSRNAPYLRNMKDAGLDNADVNMIIVGWSGGSRQIWYPQSASETRVVGTEIALTMQNLVDNYGASWDSFYCAGHSLGSHVCGHAGKRTRGGTMARITGMDPAGPWFEGKDSPEVGLWKTDAVLVDVMHTNGEAGIILNLGTMKPLGHIDFYPAGGGTQPGCILDPFEIDQATAADIDAYVDLTPACSHMRALTYYIESMRGRFTNCKYLAFSNCSDPNNIPGSCNDHSEPQGAMGFFADTYNNQGLFYLDVNRNEPHCVE
jgi:hypothetical protein